MKIFRIENIALILFLSYYLFPQLTAMLFIPALNGSYVFDKNSMVKITLTQYIAQEMDKKNSKIDYYHIDGLDIGIGIDINQDTVVDAYIMPTMGRSGIRNLVLSSDYEILFNKLLNRKV